MINRIITACSVIILSANSIFAQQPCELRKDKDDIKVYTCPLLTSKLKSIKATFTIHASADDVVNTVLDIEHYSSWQYNTIHPKVLKRIDSQELIYYTEIVAPWPISNRDMVIHLTIIHDVLTKNVIITANSIPDYIADKEGIIRVPASQSKWIITQGIEDTNVEYTIQIDPGGSVPAWMVNMVCAEAPYTSFKNLKDKLDAAKL